VATTRPIQATSPTPNLVRSVGLRQVVTARSRTADRTGSTRVLMLTLTWTVRYRVALCRATAV